MCLWGGGVKQANNGGALMTEQVRNITGEEHKPTQHSYFFL